MKRICLMTCYMGPLPGYFDYYVASCKQNKNIDFVVINDSITKSYVDENIRFIKMTLQEVNAFASSQLNEKIHLQSAWKINELKPLFGMIFREELKPYDFWGWCDLDIIWGNLRHYLTDELLAKYDVITSKEFWTAGHFTLFRNTPLCNTLYKRYANIIQLLNDATYYAFEECCHRWNEGVFEAGELSAKNLPLSMFDIVKTATANGELKSFFKDVIREHPQVINYRYKNGQLTDLENNEEFMYYHLITVKKIWRYFIPRYRAGCDSLLITAYGIRCEEENKVSWFARRAYSCYKGIKKSAKKQSAGELLKKLFR